VLEGFDGFEFNTTREQDVGFSVRFRDGRGRVAAARLSDGTLHFIGLAALLVLGGDDLPAIVCLEEPEVGLNSAAMRRLVRLIYEVSSRGQSQILISTHSPYLLTELWNGSSANPFESFNYVTLAQSGSDHGFSNVRPMSALARESSLRRDIDVRAAVKLLDGTLSEC
jgi:AAA15 family ATPase/GTPase